MDSEETDFKMYFSVEILPQQQYQKFMLKIVPFSFAQLCWPVLDLVSCRTKYFIRLVIHPTQKKGTVARTNRAHIHVFFFLVGGGGM